MACAPLVFARPRELQRGICRHGGDERHYEKNGIAVCRMHAADSGQQLDHSVGAHMASRLQYCAGACVGDRRPVLTRRLNDFQWVEILNAIVFAQVTNLTLASHREAAWRRLAGLRSSEERLRAEVAHRRRTADKLAESEAMLRTIFDATIDLVTIVRFSDGRLIDVNAPIEHYGLSREKALGSTTLSIGLWPEAERRPEFQRQINRDGIVRNFQFEMIHPNGTPITILMSSAVAQIKGEKCIVSIARDISRLKANERDVARNTHPAERESGHGGTFG
jgi:PAS domain S-box-containing protein